MSFKIENNSLITVEVAVSAPDLFRQRQPENMEDMSPTTFKSLLTGWIEESCSKNDIAHTNKIAVDLAVDTIEYVCGYNKPPHNRYALTMRRGVDDMLVKHEYLFNGMVNKLHITLDNLELTFENVMCELLRDDAMNWGRVISVYAFAARIAKHLIEANTYKEDTVLHKVAEICGIFVATKLRTWIEKQGGWVSMENLMLFGTSATELDRDYAFILFLFVRLWRIY